MGELPGSLAPSDPPPVDPVSDLSSSLLLRLLCDLEPLEGRLLLDGLLTRMLGEAAVREELDA